MFFLKCQFGLQSRNLFSFHISLFSIILWNLNNSFFYQLTQTICVRCITGEKEDPLSIFTHISYSFRNLTLDYFRCDLTNRSLCADIIIII